MIYIETDLGYIMVSLTEELNMQDKELMKQATDLVVSTRGQIMVGRAFNCLIKELEKVDLPMREVSTIYDMYLLKDHFGIDLDGGCEDDDLHRPEVI